MTDNLMVYFIINNILILINASKRKDYRTKPSYHTWETLDSKGSHYVEWLEAQ